MIEIPSSIVCQDYAKCTREHAGGMSGTPVHPPEGALVRAGHFDNEWAGWIAAPAPRDAQ
jgi:hypothetical protein